MTSENEDMDLEYFQYPLKQAKTSQYQSSTFVVV